MNVAHAGIHTRKPLRGGLYKHRSYSTCVRVELESILSDLGHIQVLYTVLGGKVGVDWWIYSLYKCPDYIDNYCIYSPPMLDLNKLCTLLIKHYLPFSFPFIPFFFLFSFPLNFYFLLFSFTSSLSFFFLSLIPFFVPLLSSCLTSYSLPDLTGKELEKLEENRGHRSKFVQELLLSTLAYSDSSTGSSSDDGDGDGDHEQT